MTTCTGVDCGLMQGYVAFADYNCFGQFQWTCYISPSTLADLTFLLVQVKVLNTVRALSDTLLSNVSQGWSPQGAIRTSQHCNEG